MRRPDRADRDEERPSPEARRQAMKVASLRPMNLLVVVIGAVYFTLTLAWWIIPLTLATYAALILVAPRDQILHNKVLERRERQLEMQLVSPNKDQTSPPDQRARRLPHGETRQKVEAALKAQRRTMVAIEEAGDVTRAALGDAIPKLHLVIERFVDVAEKREQRVRAIQDLENNRSADLAELEKELRAADAEIFDALEKLSSFRTRIVRVSTESGGAIQKAVTELNADLDVLNLRLDGTLRSVTSPLNNNHQHEH